MTRRTTAIIGAGIIGCLIARELADRDRDASIVVLDRDAIGAGASRRSAGLFLPKGTSARTRRMSAYSHAYYADLRARRPDLPIRPVGATVITDGAPERPVGERYHSVSEHQPAAPASMTGLASRSLSVPDGAQAWRVPRCHHADVYQVAQAMAAELRPKVAFLEGVEVTGVEVTGSVVTVTLGTGERLVADSVVLAPGPWLAGAAWCDLLGPLGLRVKKIVAAHIEQRPGPADDVVVFDDADAFLLPLPHRGHWLFSYTCQEWDVDPDALTGGLTAADLAAARDCLRRYAPELASACLAGRVFCDAYSPDAEPVVRRLDAAGLIVFAGAANGSGYRLGPAISAAAVDLLHAAREEGNARDHQYV